MKTLHISLIAVSGIVPLVVFGMYIISNPIIQLSTTQACPSTDISKISTDMVANLPTKLPFDYALQGIVANSKDQIMVFYANHTLCTTPRNVFNTDYAQLRLVITKVAVPENSTAYTNNWIKYASDPEINIAKPQLVHVNSYDGVGWDRYNAVPSELFFLNDNDQTQYSLFGLDNQSLIQLLDISRSIPP